jgi:heterotetrameric sarcosine oxidase gamma subunit
VAEIGVTLTDRRRLGLTALHGPADLLPGLPSGPAAVVLPQGTAIWTAPGQWLLLHPRDAAPAVPQAHRTPLTGARRIITVAGPRAREALATFLPIDLHDSAFPDGAAASTIGAYIPVLVWREGDAFTLACYRSFGDSLMETLVTASHSRGLMLAPTD